MVHTRVIFVTVAFGVGIDCRDVQRVFHVGVLCTMVDFFQGTGRAGRNGSQSHSICYYNSYDISNARKDLTPIMQKYFITTACRRVVKLQHFQAVPMHPSSHNCCDNCSMLCMCDDCVYSRELDKTLELVTSESSSECAAKDALTLPSEDQLRSDLENLRLSL